MKTKHYPRYIHGRLDPDAEALLDALALSPSPPPSAISPAQARASFVLPSWTGAPAPLASVRDVHAPGPTGDIRLRAYVPHGRGPFPVLVFFHGGGFVVGTLDEFDAFCSRLAAGAGCVVASVDYRLAPEHRCPAALDDAEAALRWVAAHATELGGDPGRLAVAGDSAGGCLAASLALASRERGRPRLALQVLLSPWVDLSSCETESFRLFGEGRWLSTAGLLWYRDHYLARAEQALDPRVSPLLAPDLRGAPPAFVVNAEHDVLRDQADALARRLEAAGAHVTYRLYPGTLHDFVTLPGLFSRASQAIDDVCSALRGAFATPASRGPAGTP